MSDRQEHKKISLQQDQVRSGAMDRRSFFRRSGLVAGGAALSLVAAACSTSDPVDTDPTDEFDQD